MQRLLKAVLWIAMTVLPEEEESSTISLASITYTPVIRAL